MTKLLSKKLPKDHPLFKRGFIIGGHYPRPPAKPAADRAKEAEKKPEEKPENK